MASTKCKHCEFLGKVFPESMTSREYWIMTEVFVYLHGKDSCDKAVYDFNEELKTTRPKKQPHYISESGKVKINGTN